MSDTPNSVATARAKYNCPACGADAHWNPAKQALICPFCGTESPATLEKRGDETVIVEHDLVTALRTIPDDARGWQASKTSVRCQSCQAISVFDADKVGRRCDFCGSSQLLPYTEVKDVFRPESLLVMKVSESQARDLIRAWYGSLWLAPNKLKSKALTDTVKGLYLPYWTFDAKVQASWSADAGDYYTETGSNGKTVTRTRWHRVAGELSHFFDDELVPASKGIHEQWLRGVEPFPTASLTPYDPGYLAGWTVERYQLDLVYAASKSRQQMEAKLRSLCAAQIRADTHRNLQVQSTFSEQRFKHILAPIWILTYNYGQNCYQVLINGVTGKIAGGRPWSWVKIGILAVLGLLALLYFVGFNSSFDITIN